MKAKLKLETIEFHDDSSTVYFSFITNPDDTQPIGYENTTAQIPIDVDSIKPDEAHEQAKLKLKGLLSDILAGL